MKFNICCGSILTLLLLSATSAQAGDKAGMLFCNPARQPYHSGPHHFCQVTALGGLSLKGPFLETDPVIPSEFLSSRSPSPKSPTNGDTSEASYCPDQTCWQSHQQHSCLIHDSPKQEMASSSRVATEDQFRKTHDGAYWKQLGQEGLARKEAVQRNQQEKDAKGPQTPFSTAPSSPSAAHTSSGASTPLPHPSSPSDKKDTAQSETSYVMNKTSLLPKPHASGATPQVRKDQPLPISQAGNLAGLGCIATLGGLSPHAFVHCGIPKEQAEKAALALSASSGFLFQLWTGNRELHDLVIALLISGGGAAAVMKAAPAKDQKNRVIALAWDRLRTDAKNFLAAKKLGKKAADTAEKRTL